VDIHCGNVRISEHGCELLDVEFGKSTSPLNWIAKRIIIAFRLALAGQSNINRPSMIQCKYVKVGGFSKAVSFVFNR
jgi:hypothetical protein